MTSGEAPHDRRYLAWLTASAAAYAVGHHLGLLPDGLGQGPDGTRWAYWLDLLLPCVVLAPAAATLAAARAPARLSWLLGLGAVAYASGHGVHLAANSVANADPGPTAHLWDEVVGHAVWYAGVALVLAAVAATTVGRPRPRRTHGWAHLLALAVGLTWATNTLGGGSMVLGIAVAAVASGFGWQHRHGLGVVLLTGFAPAVVLLTAHSVAAA